MVSIKSFPLHLVARHRRTSIILIQTGLISMSYVAAFVLRADFKYSSIPVVDWAVVLEGFPVLLAARLTALWHFGLLRGLWRYVSIPDLVQIMKATAASSLIFAIFVFFQFETAPYKESVLVLDAAGNLLALGGIRIVTRMFYDRRRRIPIGTATKRLLIVGAGDAGAALCKEVLISGASEYLPVAMLDDGDALKGDSIYGVPIAGRTEEIGRVATSFGIDVAIIAMPSASSEQRRPIVNRCIELGIPFRILPDSPTISLRNATLGQVREIEPSDLMLRPAATPDYGTIRESIAGARVLITGAAGSVGSELVEQIADLAPGSIIAADRSENQLFLLAAHLRDTRKNLPFIPCVIDTAIPHELTRVMTEHRPTIVFHAAAYKHVPLMEFYPASAVTNNVGGTLNVARMAVAHGVEQFGLVSTDKAVNPSSVMGVTKRIAEQIIWDFNDQGRTRFTAVRFGNVLGSNASVVPIFREQILRGGPVTITHKDVTRYFMSIPEAAGLILQAATISEGGEVFLLDMGQRIRIVELAETLIELSGNRPYHDIDIVFTGLRPGEKMHEELSASGEDFIETAYPKLLVAKHPKRENNIVRTVEELLYRVHDLTAEELKAQLQQVIPEYTREAGN